MPLALTRGLPLAPRATRGQPERCVWDSV